MKQYLSFNTADFWSSLSYKLAEQKPKLCLTWDFLSALVILMKSTGETVEFGRILSDSSSRSRIFIGNEPDSFMAKCGIESTRSQKTWPASRPCERADYDIACKAACVQCQAVPLSHCIADFWPDNVQSHGQESYLQLHQTRRSLRAWRAGLQCLLDSKTPESYAVTVLVMRCTHKVHCENSCIA